MRINKETIVIYTKADEEVHIHQDPDLFVTIPKKDLVTLISTLIKIKEKFDEK